MYPIFIDVAREERNDRAERTFTYANKVEKIHFDFFEAALKDIKEGKQTADATYYVCQVCGNTVRNDIPEKCPVCGATAKAFKKIE
jgi:rubrerythrin